MLTSGNQCHNDAQYGSTCIRLTGHGLPLQDVRGLRPPNRDYLTRHKWALRLTRYPCNPIGQPPSVCSPTKKWFTRARHGNPPKNSTFCTVFQPQGVGFSQCTDYGLAYAAAEGDWRHFFRLPHQFHRSLWLCTDLVVRVHHHWRPNGAAASKGDRGCAEVHT